VVLAICALIICALYVSYDMIFGSSTEDNSECVFRKYKKFNGIFYGGCIDKWHLSHLLFWTMIGLLAPGYYISVILASVGWELYEHCVFKYMMRCSNTFCGRYEDVIINIIGYIIGSMLVLLYDTNYDSNNISSMHYLY